MFTKQDKVNAENLIRILKRAKMELDGAEEVLATAEVLRWTGGLVAKIDKMVQEQEARAKAEAAALTAKELPLANPPQPETQEPAKPARSKKKE